MYIYVASFSKHPGLIKVGCSKNVQHRISVLSMTHGEAESIWCKLVGEDYYDIEKTIHVALHDKRMFVNGEGGTEFFVSSGNFSKDCEEIDKIVETLGCSYTSAKYEKIISNLRMVFDTDINLSSSQRMLLVVLLMYASKDNVYGFGIENLCTKTGLGRAGVLKILSQLKTMGIVEKYDKKFYIIHIEKIADARYATQAELDKRRENQKSVDKPSPAVQQSSHQQGFSHPDYDDDEEYSPF